MKANELMIGDWVCHKDWPSIPIRVCGISKRVSFEHSLLWNEDNREYVRIERYSECDYDEIKPIPLTPEILEKNGFTHSFGDSDFYDYEKWEKKVDDKTTRVIKDHDGWFCRVDDNKLTRSMGIAPAVHTMQNIIRIGGIEKTIEL